VRFGLTVRLICYNIVITMQFQTVFKAGNSSVITIPKPLARELGIRPGQKVVVEKTSSGDGLIISKVGKSGVKRARLDAEFKKWLEVFLKENAEILDELAVR
jgi:antitoxin component of MazEF toxin-antitoxin module